MTPQTAAALRALYEQMNGHYREFAANSPLLGAHVAKWRDELAAVLTQEGAGTTKSIDAYHAAIDAASSLAYQLAHSEPRAAEGASTPSQDSLYRAAKEAQDAGAAEIAVDALFKRAHEMDAAAAEGAGTEWKWVDLQESHQVIIPYARYCVAVQVDDIRGEVWKAWHDKYGPEQGGELEDDIGSFASEYEAKAACRRHYSATYQTAAAAVPTGGDAVVEVVAFRVHGPVAVSEWVDAKWSDDDGNILDLAMKQVAENPGCWIEYAYSTPPAAQAQDAGEPKAEHWRAALETSGDLSDSRIDATESIARALAAKEAK